MTTLSVPATLTTDGAARRADAPPIRGVGFTTLLLGGVALDLSLTLLMASALGFILLNSPAAVVAFFILPQLWGNVVALVPWLSERGPWLHLNQAMAPLLSTLSERGDVNWLQVLSAAGLWVVLPLAVGFVRVLKAEVK